MWRALNFLKLFHKPLCSNGFIVDFIWIFLTCARWYSAEIFRTKSLNDISSEFFLRYEKKINWINTKKINKITALISSLGFLKHCYCLLVHCSPRVDWPMFCGKAFAVLIKHAPLDGMTCLGYLTFLFAFIWKCEESAKWIKLKMILNNFTSEY